MVLFPVHRQTQVKKEIERLWLKREQEFRDRFFSPNQAQKT